MSKYSALLAFSVGIFLSIFSQIIEYELRTERQFDSETIICGTVQDFKSVSTYHRMVRMSSKKRLTIISQAGDLEIYNVKGESEKAISRLMPLNNRYVCLTLVSVNGFYEPTFIKSISIEGFSMVDKESIRKEYFSKLSLLYYVILLISLAGASFSAYKLIFRKSEVSV